MAELTKEFEYEMMLKLNDQLDKWLAKTYKPEKIEVFSKDIRDEYLKKVESVLVDIDDFVLTSFMFPDGSLKRLVFNLDGFEINELYKAKLNIDHKTIYSRINIHHENIKCLGFTLDDVLLAGGIRTGYNPINRELSFHYNPIYYKPSNAILDHLEEFLPLVDTLYCCADTHPCDTFAKFSLSNGDSKQEIKRFINESYFKFQN